MGLGTEIRTLDFRRAFRAHILVVQVPHLLFLRRRQWCRVRGPCVLADDVAVCVSWACRGRHRGAWCAVHIGPIRLDTESVASIEREVCSIGWAEERVWVPARGDETVGGDAARCCGARWWFEIWIDDRDLRWLSEVYSGNADDARAEAARLWVYTCLTALSFRLSCSHILRTTNRERSR